MSLPDPLVRLIEELQRLPGIGPKGAQRLAFHLLRTPREQTDRLVDAVRDVKERVTYCSVCNNITDSDPCVDGEYTAVYLARLLKPLGVKVTRIAMGLPVGSDLDYADEITMHRALEG